MSIVNKFKIETDEMVLKGYSEQEIEDINGYPVGSLTGYIRERFKELLTFEEFSQLKKRGFLDVNDQRQELLLEISQENVSKSEELIKVSETIKELLTDDDLDQLVNLGFVIGEGN